jgi:hypothetical protein
MWFMSELILRKQDQAKFQVYEKSGSVVAYVLDLILGITVVNWAWARARVLRVTFVKRQLLHRLDHPLICSLERHIEVMREKVPNFRYACKRCLRLLVVHVEQIAKVDFVLPFGLNNLLRAFSSGRIRHSCSPGRQGAAWSLADANLSGSTAP